MVNEQSKLNPKSAEVQFKLANLWQSRGIMKRAIAGYEEAVRLRPDYVPAHLELANLFLRQGKIDEAIAVYRRAIEQNPNEDCIRKNLEGIVAQKEEQYDENQTPYDRVLTSQQRAEPKHGHVMLFTDRPGINGAEQCSHVLMLSLAASGYKVTCVQGRASHYLIDERRQAGIDHMWLEDDDIYDMKRTPRAFTNFSEAHKIYSSAEPDLIIFSDGCPLSNLTAKQLAGELGIPYIMVVHCVTPEWAQLFAPYLHQLPHVYTQAQAVISVSEENLRLLRKLFGLAENKGQVTYNGRSDCYFATPDPSVRSRLRQSLKIPESAIVSFTAARMEMNKGYQYQLKAIKQLRQSQVWPQLYFVWAGIGSLESQLRAVIDQMGASDNVKFLGEREDVPDLLDAADIFILPSQFEGLPLSITEAMAKGLPVIATGVSGTPEALGQTGKLLPDPGISPQETIKGLTTTIEAWAANPELRYATGQVCKTRAEEMFREERMIEKYLRIVKRIFLSKGSGEMMLG